MEKARRHRRHVEGIVTSDKMDKTITVRIERIVKVPKYGKYIRRHGACHAHDENNDARIGDRVTLMATRPLSKTKAWRLVEVLRRSVAAEMAAQAESAEAQGQ